MASNLLLKNNKIKSAGDILNSTINAYHLRGKLNQYAVFALWKEIVGPEVAKITKPTRIIRNTIMLINVIDGSWVQELTLRKPEILAQIQQTSVGAPIADLRFVATNPLDFTKAHK